MKLNLVGAAKIFLASLGIAALACQGCVKTSKSATEVAQRENADHAAPLPTAKTDNVDAREPDAALPLITGKKIPPSLAVKKAIGNLPMNLIKSPDGRFAITSDMGNREALWSLRLDDGTGVSHVDIWAAASRRRGGRKRQGRRPAR
jgi:hypothetical protein